MIAILYGIHRYIGDFIKKLHYSVFCSEAVILRRLIYRVICFLLIAGLGASLCPVSDVFAKSTSSKQDEAAEEKLSLTKKEKILYLGGCNGITADGKKAPFLAHVNVRKLIKGFSAKKHDITLKTGFVQIAAVDNDKDRIEASGVGETVVTVMVKDKKSGKKLLKAKLKIIVRLSANARSFRVEGLDENKSIYDGDTFIVSMPGSYTDKRMLICDCEESVDILPLEDGKSFEVTFPDPGDYVLTAAAYQSEKYDGYTALKEFDITVKEREAVAIQSGADSIKLTGGPVDEDMEASEVSVYEIKDGIRIFYSYASKISIQDNEAEVSFFKPFASENEYEIEYDGQSYGFRAAPCTVDDVASFEIIEDSVRAGEEKELSFRYFNRDGLDITASVGSILNGKVQLQFPANEYFDGYISGKKLFFTKSGLKVNITASLEINDDKEAESRKLTAEKSITSLPEKGTQFTGRVIYSIKPDNGKYLLPDDECTDKVPIGDSVVLEALFEMDDGSYKKFKEAGITDFVVGDKAVVMVGKQTSTGGYRLILNNIGSTGIVAFRGEEVAGSFNIEVLPKRKPSELRTELSKEYLNTNIQAEDYILIKADMYDQYGALIDTDGFSICQTEASRKDIGDVNFTEISKGRFILNGYECPSFDGQRVVLAKVSSEGFEENIKICLCDIAYDSSSSEYKYKLKFDGSRLIDTAITLKKDAPKSTFVTVEISKDDYFVGEGIGYFFDEFPDVRHNAAYYGVTPDTGFYGMSIEYSDGKDKDYYIGEDDDCIIPSYSELEFIPYIHQKKLPEGTYKVSVYHVTAGEDISYIELCDSAEVIVVDSDPEVEVVQKLQSYTSKPDGGWKNAIAQYFSFYLDGEDISGYITKVDCVEGSTGTVFVRSVEFLMSDPYFGAFTKTAEIERLIIKQ